MGATAGRMNEPLFCCCQMPVGRSAACSHTSSPMARSLRPVLFFFTRRPKNPDVFFSGVATAIDGGVERGVGELICSVFGSTAFEPRRPPLSGEVTLSETEWGMVSGGVAGVGATGVDTAGGRPGLGISSLCCAMAMVLGDMKFIAGNDLRLDAGLGDVGMGGGRSRVWRLL